MRERSFFINKINATYTLVIALLVLMDCSFFYFVTPPSFLSRFWGTYAKFLLVVVAALLFIWSNGWKNTDLFLKRYFIGLTVSFAIVSVFSALRYDGEQIYNHVLLYGGVFLAILAFPMLKLFHRQGGYEKLFAVLNGFAFLIYLIFIAQAFLYKTTGQMMLNIEYSQRNGNLRMGLSAIGNVMVLYNFCKVFCTKKRKKLFPIIQLVLGLYCVFFIQQTRAYYIAFCVSFAAVLLFASENKIKTLRNILLVAAAAGAAIYSGVLNQFLDSFSETSSEAAGNIARNGAFTYFWNEFLKNPILGHGFLTSDMNLTIRTGPKHIYYYADTGFVGLLAQMGLFAIPVYIWPVVHWGRMVLKNFKTLDPFLVGLFVYILTTTPTLILTNPERNLLIPLALALYAYATSCEKQVCTITGEA